MSVAQTVLVYVVIPGAIYGVTALVTLRSKFTRSPHYKAGDPWEFEPVWWAANPKGLDPMSGLPAEATVQHGAQATARGGARGNW